MQITVNIPDELAAQAQACGLTPENFVETLLGDALRTAPNLHSKPKSPEQMRTFFEEMARHSDAIPQLPDEAFTRESFYQDHD